MCNTTNKIKNPLRFRERAKFDFKIIFNALEQAVCYRSFKETERVHLIFAMAYNFDIGQNGGMFLQYVDSILEKHNFQYVYMTVIDESRISLITQERVNVTLTNDMERVEIVAGNDIDDERIVGAVMKTSVYDDLEFVLESMSSNCSKRQSDVLTKEAVHSYNFRKLKNEELSSLNKKEINYINTFKRYHDWSLLKDSPGYVDNTEFVTNDLLRMKTSESKSRYASMICHRYTCSFKSQCLLDDYKEHNRSLWIADHMKLKTETKPERKKIWTKKKKKNTR